MIEHTTEPLILCIYPYVFPMDVIRLFGWFGEWIATPEADKTFGGCVPREAGRSARNYKAPALPETATYETKHQITPFLFVPLLLPVKYSDPPKVKI